jgi:ABC-2 type transport system ATP-binding protein
MDAISVRGLTKRFGAVVAVEDVTFALSRGTVAGFLGPNGAGKTTTLRAILGLIRPTAGVALFGGTPYPQLADPLRHVGALLESTSFHPGRTPKNHLRGLAIVAGLDGSRVDDVLREVDLAYAADRRVGAFSLGMRQRLGLAAALLGDPEVLILDEPANGLDPDGIAWLRTFVRSFAARGRTVLVSSHVLSEVAQTVDEVLIINRGQLLTHEPLVPGEDLEQKFFELTRGVG